MDFIERVGVLFQQCATSTFLNDFHLKDSLCTQLDCVLGSLEEALQIVRGEADIESLRQLQLRARGYQRVLVSSVNTCSILSPTITSLQHVELHGYTVYVAVETNMTDEWFKAMDACIIITVCNT